MKRFTSLFLQDLTLAYRSGHILITVLILLVILALVVFLPREFKIHNELFYDATPEGRLAAYLTEKGAPAGQVYSAENGGGEAGGDEASFREALASQPMKVGVIFRGSLEQPEFEILAANNIAPETLGLLEVSLESAIRELRGGRPAGLPVTYLRTPTAPPAFNLNLVPVALVFEVVLLGFFIVAVMMFQEKQEGTLLAYRVTPAGALGYLFSKTLLFILLSLGYALPVVLVGFGGRVNWGALGLLIVLSSSLMTLFSLAVAVFFRNLSEWFFVGVAILVVNSLPMISYGFPAFAPAWLTLIPSYPAVFATREVLFHAAGLAESAPTLLYLAGLNLLALAAAYAAVRFKLLKEGR